VSLRHGFVKKFSSTSEGELNHLSAFVGVNERVNNIPIHIIDSGSEIVNNISSNHFDVVYSGFISFRMDGALPGIGIR